MRAGALIAQRLDLERLALTGEPVTLADGVATDTNSQRSAVSVAATGLVAYRPVGSDQRQLTWFDRSGAVRGVVGEPDDTWRQPSVSRDGRRVYRPNGVSSALYQKLTNGAGAEEQIVSSDQTLAGSSWSEDGRFLMYMRIDPKANTDLWVMPMSGETADRKPFVLLQTPFREAYGVFSPDGRSVAYHSNESGRNEIYVRPFVPPGATATAATAAGGQRQVSAGGGIYALWSSDGKSCTTSAPTAR